MFLFAEGAHHTPLIVDFVNHYLGEPVHKFQMAYTHPLWKSFFAKFGTTPEAVFGGEYTPENAIPWYTIMFFIACLLTIAVVWVLKGKVSEDAPGSGQLTLEAGFAALRDMMVGIIGEHSVKYFPVIATFGILILISNLMGFFPLFLPPSAHVSVTFALGIASFIYYNYIGIRENGIGAHLGHLAGPKLSGLLIIITPFIFTIELISNLIRPLSLGIRLFGNMYADEQVAGTVSGLAGQIPALSAYPFVTQLLVPVILMPLALLVSFVQTLVFTLLSTIYISEVSHAPHDSHHAHDAPATNDFGGAHAATAEVHA